MDKFSGLQDWLNLNKPALPVIDVPKGNKIRGREHIVSLDSKKGKVYKFPMREKALIPYLNGKGKLCVKPANEAEYLLRLDYHVSLFADEIEIIGIQKSGRLVVAQQLIQGADPSDVEIEHFMRSQGFTRVPSVDQDLPPLLMMTAWCHIGVGILVVDARPANFKKDTNGMLHPIDLMIAPIVPDSLGIGSLYFI